MKKLIVLLAAILVFTMAGCGEDKKTEEKKIENITREEKAEPKKAEPSEQETEEVEKEEPSEEKVQEETTPKTKTLAEIQGEIKSAVSASGAMDLDAMAISSLYGIDGADMVQAVGFVVMEGTFPHEAVMVEAKDSGAASRVEALLKAKHVSFVEQSKGYDAENYALAQKCKVVRNGNYISMFLTPDYEAMQAVYAKYIK
jgi:hypothetical protein